MTIPFDNLATFAVAALLLGLAPGPDNIFVITLSALNGRRAGLQVVLGLCSGLVLHTLAVALGVAALIKASALAFLALKVCGVGYLLYLAFGAFRAGPQQTGTAPQSSGKRLYLRGLVMNVTNPKVLIFFLAFLPQFATPENGPVLWQILTLGGVFILITLIEFSLFALLAGSLRGVLTGSPRVQIIMNRVAGMVFVGLAAKLALSQRL